jgi:cytochrome b6-f complex iron-sulfur subunit
MQNDKISRHNFLRSLGLGGSALVAVYCTGATLTSCTNEGTIAPAPGGGLTLDLSSNANSALQSVGGFIVTNQIVVANVGNGKYVAVTHICSHEQKREVTFRNNEFYCTAHGARFDTNGKGLNANGSKGLTVYTTTLSGNTLTIS